MSMEQRPFFGRVESLRGIGAMAVAAYHFAGMALILIGIAVSALAPRLARR